MEDDIHEEKYINCTGYLDPGSIHPVLMVDVKSTNVNETPCSNGGPQVYFNVNETPCAMVDVKSMNVNETPCANGVSQVY